MQSFDLSSSEFKRDPLPTFARMRAAGPIVRTRLPIVGDTWLATTYDAVNRLLRDQENFVVNAAHAGRPRTAGLRWWMPRAFRVLSRNMLTSDEPDHRRLRGLVEQAFLRHSVEEMRGQIEQLAERGLDHLEQQARANGGSVDLIAHFTRPFPLAVICSLLGLPDEDRPKFMRWAERLTTASSVWGALAALPGIWKLLGYFQQQFRECRQRPRPGLISSLVEARQGGEQLTEDELLAMAFLLLIAGHETTVHLINGGLLALLLHPEQRAKLQADWSRVGSAVEEMLRYVSPVQMSKPRYARHDIELEGQRIKRGEFILALIGSANADPTEFESPERLDIDRQPNRHVSFGTGIHVCLGLKLARAEAAIAFERLLTRFPRLALAVDASELHWLGRVGLRSLQSLPVKLAG